MKIRRLEVTNLRAIRHAQIELRDVLAIVGRNNSGKSTLLRALSFFFEPSKRVLDQDWFPNQDLSKTVAIKLSLDDLSAWEKEQFKPYLRRDGTLTLAREVSWVDGDFQIATVAYVESPEPPWLQDEEINGPNVTAWWEVRDDLGVGDLKFGDTLGDKKPTVGHWKERAQQFVEEHADKIDWIERALRNPKGAPNVLKGALPEFILVPAVRDVHDELKVTQTNPFGRLIHSILDRITGAAKEDLANQIESLAKSLNRVGGDARLPEIVEVETRLNELMSDLMDCDVEIEMSLPTLQQVFGEARIVADDGVRTLIDAKGHGMQRSMIVTILRFYAEFASREKAGERADERSTVIAMEEPELYMHPQSQRTLMQVFQDIGSGRDQVVYTTHSSLFVDVSRFDDLCIMRRRKSEDGVSAYASQLSMDQMLSDLKARKGKEGTPVGMREQYGNAFDPRVNEGLFADKVVVVEGASEEYALPMYGSLLGYDLDRRNVAVVPSHGKGSIDRLARIFSGLGIPTYLLFDGDKSNSAPEVRAKTLELLALVGHPVDKIEHVQTVIEATHAVFEETLEETLRAEIADYDEWISECGDLMGPSGKPIKQRFIAKKIGDIITDGGVPEEVVPESIRRVLGEVQNLKECVSYLHPDAVEA